MRTAICGAILGLSCLMTARGDEWTKNWKVQGKPELRVTAGDASLTIEVGSATEISALVRTRGVDIGDSGVRITERQNGNRVELEIREPSARWGFGSRSVEVRLRVPRELMADAHTGDGSIHLSGLHGMVRVDTGDGSIEGDGLDGAFEARTGDGSVRVAGRFDELKVRTSDGSVQVKVLPGSRMSASWRVETGDGSVRLAIPRDLAADVQLRTGDGSIHSDLPLTVQGTRREHELHGKLNGGGPFLEVRTGDGSITLSGL